MTWGTAMVMVIFSIKRFLFEDRLIGQIYDSVKEREAKYGEDWLFVVTTDHGRTANNGKGTEVKVTESALHGLPLISLTSMLMQKKTIV